MKTTKQLLKEIENQTVYALVWAVTWRYLVAAVGVGLVIELLA
jgi:hypothetical protein